MSGNAPPGLTVQANGIGVYTDQYSNGLVQGAALLADLRAFTGIANMNVWMNGTNTAGDGSQGMFVWSPNSTATDDGGATAIEPYGLLTGRWLRLSSNPGSLITVPNIAALRVLPSGEAPVWVQGYYAPSDGGGGMFNPGPAASDNGGTIIVGVSGNTWYRQYQMPLDVRAFGAVCNGTTNDAAAWNACLSWLGTLGGGSLTWSGSSAISGPLSSSQSGIGIIGQGIKSSAIIPLSTTADIFDFSGAFLTFSNFLIDASGITPTAGTFFNLSGSGNMVISGISTNGGWNIATFSATNCAQVFVDDCVFNNNLNNGLTLADVVLSCFSNIAMGVIVTANATGNGVYITGGNTNTFENMNVAGYDANFLIQPAASVTINDLTFINCASDGVSPTRRVAGGSAWTFTAIANSSLIARIHLITCWAGSAPEHGFAFVGNVNDVEIANGYSYDNAFNGLELSGDGPNAPSGIRIIGGSYTGNSYNSSGTYNGINVESGVTYFKIIGVDAMVQATSVNTQGYGINIASSVTTDHYIITENTCVGNVTGGINNAAAGSHAIVTNNLTS